VHTIYIGGGTPNALSNEQLEVLLDMIKPFSLHIEEYTIEMNPERVNLEQAQLCHQYGINRVSFGVQSFDAQELKQLNRHHTTEMIQSGIQVLNQVGINNISIDLIYGLPQQSLETWTSNLEQALMLPIQHVSLYALTIEENSLFGRQKIKGVSEELEEEMYFYAVERLHAAGFSRYEISNFTQKHPSQHNLHYWKMSEYRGVGPGAVSYVNHTRIENTNNLIDYAKGKFHKNILSLSEKDEQFELIMMSLRTQRGLSRHLFKERFKQDVIDIYASAIEAGIQKNWLTLDQLTLKCSDHGLGVLHDVLLLFME
jgi:oxygen-independent coproporphyrinogen III oxidase